jgi:hypothetical protein
MSFVIGAIEIGFIADSFNMFIAIQMVAWIGVASGIIVIFLMKENKS